MTKEIKQDIVKGISHPAVLTPLQAGGSSPERTGSGEGSLPRRTFLLKALVVGYLLMGWFGGVRCYAAFTNGDLLGTYLSKGELVYIALSGAVWALAGLASAGTLWLGLPVSTRLSRWTAILCFAWYWLDDLFMAQSPLSQTGWVFSLLASLLVLAFAWIVPSLPKESRFLHRKL